MIKMERKCFSSPVSAVGGILHDLLSFWFFKSRTLYKNHMIMVLGLLDFTNWCSCFILGLADYHLIWMHWTSTVNIITTGKMEINHWKWGCLRLFCPCWCLSYTYW